MLKSNIFFDEENLDFSYKGSCFPVKPVVMFKVLFIYFQREGKGGRKRETSKTKRNMDWLPGVCPDQESNKQPSGSYAGAGAQSTEPHQPGLKTCS